MSIQTDQQLLREYAGNASEPAFSELVHRHVDLVYSAALRMVCDSHLAEDVTQGVFVALAQNARRLTHHPVLSGWLHRTTQNLAANAVRTNVRRQTREQEAVIMNELLSAEPDASWEHIAPHLDAALGELSDSDRDALLLRYFERKSANEMAQTLGTSAEAAQKRVTRAVEQLRKSFAKRGVTVGAGGLTVVIAANAVQAAPVGIASTISAIAGTTIATTASTLTTIAMTTFQKIAITTALAAAIGTGIYEAHQASTLRTQVQSLEQQQVPLAQEVEQLKKDREDTKRQLAALRDDNERLKRSATEIPKLRGDAARLRQSQQEVAKLKADGQGVKTLGDLMSTIMSDPEQQAEMRKADVSTIKKSYSALFKQLNLSPDEQQKLIDIMVDKEIYGTQKAMGLLTGDIKPDDKEYQVQMAADMKQFDDSMASLLGADKYRQLDEYEKTLPDRVNLDSFKSQSKKTPLSDDQQKQLLDVMIQERVNTPGATRPPDSKWKVDFDDQEKALNAEEQVSAQVRARAAAFLDNAQLAALTTYQNKKLASDKKDLKTFQKLFGGPAKTP